MKMYAPASFLTDLLHPFFDRVVTALAHMRSPSPVTEHNQYRLASEQKYRLDPGNPPRARILANTLDF
ncbi:hypothetical protein [Paraburkholderia fynbosensis]|uniref:Uncharacterized protein n=1 Tax=Paraburkholderia fynbosensis TaxID=1200993 RepID=A0A6J5FXI3_9BURK|nr:hypothetical protein [Paraburkholderia fynbosensis]CAB3787771.1 hypothetical protein LMG27177_02286 [Paraburkholderia fynbosensis]